MRRDNDRNEGGNGADYEPEFGDSPLLDRPDRPVRPAYLQHVGIPDHQGNRDDGQGARGGAQSRRR